MYKILALTILCILFIEFFARSSFFSNFRTLIDVSKKAVAVMGSKRISDEWKEKVLPSYSLKILISSVIMLLILSTLIVSVYLVFIFKPAYYEFFISISGLLFATIFSIVYAKFRFGIALKKPKAG